MSMGYGPRDTSADLAEGLAYIEGGNSAHKEIEMLKSQLAEVIAERNSLSLDSMRQLTAKHEFLGKVLKECDSLREWQTKAREVIGFYSLEARYEWGARMSELLEDQGKKARAFIEGEK